MTSSFDRFQHFIMSPLGMATSMVLAGPTILVVLGICLAGLNTFAQALFHAL